MKPLTESIERNIERSCTSLTWNKLKGYVYTENDSLSTAETKRDTSPVEFLNDPCYY